jgi:3-deoxy-manno-octulosonate cytidylyltransferase (CMP-KDO synthetase)
VDIFVNVQGDEPEIEPAAIDQVIELLAQGADGDVATLATPIRSRDILHDPNCVKVVRDNRGRALYFSRSPIPHPREWTDSLLERNPPLFLLHLGIYAYRRDFLLGFPGLPKSALEDIEKLEQLRVLAAGRSILVGLRDRAPAGIDTIEDYRAFVSRQRER